MSTDPRGAAIPADAPPPSLHPLRQWIGRSEALEDIVTGTPVRALAATLDLAAQPSDPGTPLPPLWHWLYFLPLAPGRELGPDGHPRRGGFLPPVPLPRRMWAGGRLQWEVSNPLRVGDAVRRASRIVDVRHKAGRAGELVFVEVRHEVHNDRGLALTEEHDIVYRAAPAAAEPPPAPVAAPAQATWRQAVVPDDVLLFRYSALTFNGHRIHYDRRYVTAAEGYPGLVVHGPLIATLLVELLRRHAPRAVLRSFEFKAVRPTFDRHAFQVCGEPQAHGGDVRLWAQDHEGWLTMQARAQIETGGAVDPAVRP